MLENLPLFPQWHDPGAHVAAFPTNTQSDSNSTWMLENCYIRQRIEIWSILQLTFFPAASGFISWFLDFYIISQLPLHYLTHSKYHYLILLLATSRDKWIIAFPNSAWCRREYDGKRDIVYYQRKNITWIQCDHFVVFHRITFVLQQSQQPQNKTKIPDVLGCWMPKYCFPKICSVFGPLLFPISSGRLLGRAMLVCCCEATDCGGLWLVLQSLVLERFSVSKVSGRDSHVDKVDFGLEDLESPESFNSRFWIFSKHQAFSSPTNETCKRNPPQNQRAAPSMLVPSC